MRQEYISKRFTAESASLIEQMNEIVDEYVAQRYRLTVRQLYYQLVSRDIVPNTERSYKRVTGIVNDAKLAGLMDWEAIEDRTRAFIRRAHWQSASEMLEAVAEQYYMDMWKTQPNRVFVIVEKEALAGVLERVCNTYDVPLLAARGYPSGTVLREFCVDDLLPALSDGKEVTILHLGDHDPSGIDMTRDLTSRIQTFTEEGENYNITLKRIALTMDQIDEQKPPPNPAKTTDSRFDDYELKYGKESWELDALKPQYLSDLVRDHVLELIDDTAWEKQKGVIVSTRKKLLKVSNDFKKQGV